MPQNMPCGAGVVRVVRCVCGVRERPPLAARRPLHAEMVTMSYVVVAVAERWLLLDKKITIVHERQRYMREGGVKRRWRVRFIDANQRLFTLLAAYAMACAQRFVTTLVAINVRVALLRVRRANMFSG